MSVYLVPSPCGSHTCVAPEPERPLNLTVGEGTAVVEVFDDGRPSHQLQPGHGPTKIQNGPVDEVFRPGQDPHARGHRVLERSEEHTSELQSRGQLVCRLLLEKKKKNVYNHFQRRYYII